MMRLTILSILSYSPVSEVNGGGTEIRFGSRGSDSGGLVAKTIVIYSVLKIR